MARYRASARVLGLAVGEEFESSDTAYHAPFVANGYLVDVTPGEDAPQDGEDAPQDGEDAPQDAEEIKDVPKPTPRSRKP